MGVIKDILRVVITLVYCYIVIKVVFPIVNAIPLDHGLQDPRDNITFLQIPAEDRMIKPPRFPYDGPFGFYSSGLLCIFDDVPYVGGWFGRSCAGPIAPFIQPTPPPNLPTPPTPPSTTPAPTPPTLPPMQPMYLTPQQMQWMQMMMMGWGSNGQSAAAPAQEEEEDYGEPVEGNPWEPDDESSFIESYGQRASKPGFRLGDPNTRHRGK